jgi:hypothetical protein
MYKVRRETIADDRRDYGLAAAAGMSETPFEQWIDCPVCEGTGADENGVDDPDYGTPKCRNCNGVGEVDPTSDAAKAKPPLPEPPK